MKNHNNLNHEQKSILGSVHAMNLTIKSLIFQFENSTYKDYEKLARDIVAKQDRRSEYILICDELNIPIENIRLFNEGIVTGLINPNKLTYIAYFE
jgi:hypothetical protein